MSIQKEDHESKREKGINGNFNILNILFKVLIQQALKLIKF